MFSEKSKQRQGAQSPVFIRHVGGGREGEGGGGGTCHADYIPVENFALTGHCQSCENV